ncbi:hypothetical protein M3690_04335 [Priestia megaterium]|uniref:hypothetical protein n=1 Tax=Priestia megaterium TaxID=1404 RepID=UPI00203C587F|nr:hypothetical protein [Priestia megaterium]MCM3792520.1 hypothetical protein [Priestia megaterium]
MLTTTDISHFVHSVIKKIWLEDISKDYNTLNLLKESSLQSAFYSHLRRRLKDDFLAKNNLKIFPEYVIGKQKADLAVVVIDPDKAKDYPLRDCVTEVISVIEMKHKDKYVSEKHFNDDVTKTLSYIKKSTFNTMYYLAFIREMYFNPGEVTNWVTSKQALKARGKLTEMYSYGDLETNKMVWHVIEH